MSADLAARLRALAQDYHDGRINLAAYRSLRAPLLDSLVMHPSSTVDAMAITQPRFVTRAAQGSAQAPAASTPAEPEKKTPVGLITLGIGLVAIAAAMVWIWHTHLSDGSGRVPATAERAEAHPVQAAVSAFVERGDWSDSSLMSLHLALSSAGEHRIAEVAREPWFVRFVDDLRTRLKEHQALSAERLTTSNSPLAAVAVDVGLDLNSPDSAIRIVAIEPPRESSHQEHADGERDTHGADAPAGVAGAVTAARSHSETAAPASGAPTEDDSSTAASVQGAAASAATRAEAGSQAPEAATQSARAAPSSQQGTTQPSEEGSAGKLTAASAPGVSSGAAGAPSTTCRRELIRSRRPLCQDTLPDGTPGPLLALIPAGSFEMGSSADPTEQPVRRVTIREPFAISVYEISQDEFARYCAETRSNCPSQPWSGGDYPVVNVSWDEARAYVKWLSEVTQQRYRLPTEAQWEYAARAGQTGLVPSGDALSPTDAHFSMVTKQTAPAPRSRKFNQNAFRLMHSIGNVREWVEDGWRDNFASAPADESAVSTASEPLRVARGGSYADTAAKLRLSTREGLPASTRDQFTGFRVVRELP